jgi:hypothetical protein
MASGEETAVGTCDVCGLVAPASLIQVVIFCICPKCLEASHLSKHKGNVAGAGNDDVPF